MRRSVGKCLDIPTLPGIGKRIDFWRYGWEISEWLVMHCVYITSARTMKIIVAA